MSDYGGAGAQRKRSTDERLDGIQKLSGTVTFTAAGASIDVTIPANGGSLSGTSQIEFAGAVGSSVGNGAVYHQAVVNTATKKLTASGLPAGDSTEQYSVKMKYTLNGSAGTALTGSVAKGTGSPSIAMQ